jgi:squalene synthase HpnC
MKPDALHPSQLAIETAAEASLMLTKQHYENFPVASILLPKPLRQSVAVIYQFARQADDFADEGDDTIAQRLAKLQAFRDELDLIQAYIRPNNALFLALQQVIQRHHLPLQPFYDLLDAFSQDVVKTRYDNFDEVMHYCERSANPIGELMLHLYQAATPHNITLSNHICSALQLINFYQDIAIDIQKHKGEGRIYLCQDEMQQFNVTEAMIRDQVNNPAWQSLMAFNLVRATQLLQEGKPLGKRLKGRIGFELRMMIAGGERILTKLNACHGDIFHRRPTLKAWDWLIILVKATLRV